MEEVQISRGLIYNQDFVSLLTAQGRIYFDEDGIRGGRRLVIYQMRYNQTGNAKLETGNLNFTNLVFLRKLTLESNRYSV